MYLNCNGFRLKGLRLALKFTPSLRFVKKFECEIRGVNKSLMKLLSYVGIKEEHNWKMTETLNSEETLLFVPWLYAICSLFYPVSFAPFNGICLYSEK